MHWVVYHLSTHCNSQCHLTQSLRISRLRSQFWSTSRGSASWRFVTFLISRSLWSIEHSSILAHMVFHTTLIVTNLAESTYFPKVMSDLLSLYWTEDIAHILIRYRSTSMTNAEYLSWFQRFCVPYSVYTTLVKGSLSVCWKGITYSTPCSWTGLLTRCSILIC